MQCSRLQKQLQEALLQLGMLLHLQPDFHLLILYKGTLALQHRLKSVELKIQVHEMLIMLHDHLLLNS